MTTAQFLSAGKLLTLSGLILLAGAGAALAADATGVWKWKFTTQGGDDIELSLDLKQEGEKLTGKLTLPGRDEAIEIKDGTVKDNEVAFHTVFERNGNSFTTRYKGKVDADTIKGQIERERGGEKISRDWEAKREKK